MYDKLVAKLNSLDISGFVLKTKYHTEKKQSLVFQSMCRYFKRVAGVSTGNYIYF